MVNTELHRHPFWILGASTRDNRHRIVELAEEKGLVLDSEECTKARNQLTNPRNRLAAELSWLPGVSPSRAASLIEQLSVDPDNLRHQENVPPLVRANLFSAAFAALDPETDVSVWIDSIKDLALAVDRIDAEALLREINEDRGLAGFPAVPDVESVAAELGKLRHIYRTRILDAIDRLAPMVLVKVLTEVVDSVSNSGNSPAPILIDEVIDSYEVKIQSFLSSEADNVRTIVNNVMAAAPSGEPAVNSLLDQLTELIQRWDNVAQPIQLSMMSRGVEHEMSQALAIELRGLAVDLANEYGMLDPADRITNLVKEVFAELPEVVVRSDEDSAALADLFAGRDAAVEQAEEWASEIAFDAELGVVFKDRLSISTSGIQWKEMNFPLDTITRMRWGVTRHSVNFIPTGTTYEIWFGDASRVAHVTPKKESVFQEFIGKLWLAVGSRMIMDMLQALRDGSKFRFGDLVLDDKGVDLPRHKFFGSGERIYGNWSQVSIWNANGSFVIGLTDDKKAYAALSYQEIDNVHLLEFMIRAKFKTGTGLLSNLLNQ